MRPEPASARTAADILTQENGSQDVGAGTVVFGHTGVAKLNNFLARVVQQVAVQQVAEDLLQRVASAFR